MDLVNRYLVEAHGPPPRSPLRFWIGGEWVEIDSPQPEPLRQASGAQEAPPVEPTHPSADLEQTMELPVSIETVPPPGPGRERRLPIYEWITAEVGEHRGAAPKVRPLPQPEERRSAPRALSVPGLPRRTRDERANPARLFSRKGTAAEVASKLRDFDQRDDHKLVRGEIASLREQRDAGEITHTDFATRVAALVNGAVAPRIASEGNPSGA